MQIKQNFLNCNKLS